MNSHICEVIERCIMLLLAPPPGLLSLAYNAKMNRMALANSHAACSKAQWNSRSKL